MAIESVGRKTAVTPIKFVLSLITFIVSSPFVLVVTLICVIYRQIVRLILKIRHGSRFDGLLQGPDVAHTLDSRAKAVISCMLILESDDSLSGDEFWKFSKKVSKEIWFESSLAPTRTHYTFQSFLGYSYWLKINVNPDQCIRKLKLIGQSTDHISKTDFMTLANEYFNKALPDDNTVLWELEFSGQPIDWTENKSNTGTHFYAALLRVHHTVADGVALLKFMTSLYGSLPNNVKIVHSKVDNNNTKSNGIQNGEKLNGKKEQNDWLKEVEKSCKEIAIALYVLALAPLSMYYQLTVRAIDKTTAALTEKKILALKHEDDKLEYVNKVKKIKSKVKGSTFTDIIMAAFCASLSDYYHENCPKPPQRIAAVVPIYPGSSELQHLVPGEIPKTGINFCNGFSLVIPVLPILPCDKFPILQMLKLVMEDTETLKHSVDFHVNYWLSHLFGVFPSPLARVLLGGMHSTSLISIIAGPPLMAFHANDILLQYLLFWSPHHEDIGMCFCSITYADRLHVMLSTDTGVIADKNVAQGILDGVFRKIDLLEIETESLT